MQFPQNVFQNNGSSLNSGDLSLLISCFQKQALQSELFTLLEMRKQMFQQFAQPFPLSLETGVKLEPEISSNVNQKPLPLSEKPVNSTKPKLEFPQDVIAKKKKTTEKEQFPDSKVMKVELEEMINFILNSIGKLDQNVTINKGRAMYANKPYLLPIFDTLAEKYMPVRKHREDIIRYIIRRALKFMKKSIIEKEKVYGKRAYAALCKKYFQLDYEKLEKLGINAQDEKELIEFLLPYRKNSKNRTMNTDFTSEIFASPEFCSDYKEFLKGFGDSLNDDNTEKIKKLIQLSEECIRKNSTNQIKKCSRLPWLDAWTEKAKETANSLIPSEISQTKQLKSNLSESLMIKSESE